MKTAAALAFSAAVLCSSALPALAGESDAQQEFERGFYLENGERDLEAAAKVYGAIVARQDSQRELVARALVRMGVCLMELGRTGEAKKALERVLAEFKDRKDAVEEAGKALRELEGSDAKKPPSGEEAVIKALEAKADMSFQDTPFPDVLSFLRQASGVNIVEDPEPASSEESLMVNFSVTQIPLRSALDLLTGLNGRSWVIVHDVVCIGKPHRLARYLSQYWSWSESASTAPGPGVAEADLAVARALEGKLVSLNLDDTPLPAAIEFLREVAQVNIVISPQAREMIKDTAIALALDELRLDHVLQLILMPRDLAYEVRDGVLVIEPTLRDGPVGKALEQVLSYERESMSLQDIVRMVRETAGSSLLVDPDLWRTRPEAEFGAGGLKSGTLRQWLDRFTRAAGAGWGVVNGAIILTDTASVEPWQTEFWPGDDPAELIALSKKGGPDLALLRTLRARTISFDVRDVPLDLAMDLIRSAGVDLKLATRISAAVEGRKVTLLARGLSLENALKLLIAQFAPGYEIKDGAVVVD